MKEAHLSRKLVEEVDRARCENGFLCIEQMLVLAETNTIYDPLQTLVGSAVKIGERNTLFPNTVIQTLANGNVTIGSGNTFFPGAFFQADQAEIIVGDNNEFGAGTVVVKAAQECRITICDGGRYLNGIQIIGNTYLGPGTQLLGGMLTVQDCYLSGGESYIHPVADERGALLKGAGIARNIRLETGQVVQAYGIFSQEDVHMQSYFHPKQP